MNWRDKRGFTLVELGLGMLSAAILALLAGVLLFYSYTGWRKNIADVQVQGDRTVAMTALNRSFREATNATIPAPGQITVYLTNRTALFYVSGSNLVFDPNAGTGGDAVTLVKGRLVTFGPQITNGTVKVALVLREADGRLSSNDTVTTFRN